MLNHITLMGRLCFEPELKVTGSGVKVVTARIACDRDYAGKDGGDKKVDFIDITAWRAKAEFICRNFHKGDPILVDGRLEMRSWEDRDGNKRVSAEVNVDNAYFCGGKRRDSGGMDGDVDSFSSAKLEDFDDDGELPWDVSEDEQLPL